MSLAPVALFVYKRPEQTRRTVEALRANSPAAESELWVFADAAKSPVDAQAVANVRSYIRSISGFASITVIERERNLGLAGSVADGISRLCDSHGRVIAVEDDLIVAPSFLKFLNAGLDRFADDERVYQISGYMFPKVCKGTHARFLPLTTTWGWGTWQRAWRHLDRKLAGLSVLEANTGLRHRFDLNGAYDYFEMACRQKRGQVDSWGIAWYLSVFLRDGLVLYPAHSLVVNAGIDGSGTHGQGPPALQGEIATLERDVEDDRLPNGVEVDRECLLAIERLLRSMRPSLLGRIKAWVNR